VTDLSQASTGFAFVAKIDSRRQAPTTDRYREVNPRRQRTGCGPT
jgi:hypothetical protein